MLYVENYKIYKYSILSYEHQGTVEICSPYPEFVLTGALVENNISTLMIIVANDF